MKTGCGVAFVMPWSRAAERDFEDASDPASPAQLCLSGVRVLVVNVPEVIPLLRLWGLDAPSRPKPLATQGHSSTVWLVEAAGERFVAKLIHDRRRYAEPGLRVAAAVEAGGVRTGAPLPTVGGDLCAAVEVDGRECTLALLRFVPGNPLDPGQPDAAEIAGGLLGRVHAILLRDSARDWVPNDLLDWCESYAETRPAVATDHALSALARLRDLGGQRTAAVYGDPTPEILVDESGEPALIDWGTPSWGPLAHDLACWLRHLDGTEGFLAAYEKHVALGPVDREAIPRCRELVEALAL
jgi:Ser/Thr protein kinase RdoA (MazF antagonist)